MLMPLGKAVLRMAFRKGGAGAAVGVTAFDVTRWISSPS